MQLSPALQRDTVVLEAANGKSPGGRARVYVLGVSHVSRESCEEAAELIGAVRPDAVLLELCKDRLRLLLDQVPLPVRHPLPFCIYIGLPCLFGNAEIMTGRVQSAADIMAVLLEIFGCDMGG